jgi:predicted nucleic-acid-binding protein
MRAIDTNVLVRFLTADEPTQFRRARKAIESGRIFLAKTVLLETEWVLRHLYGFAPADIVGAFDVLAAAAEIEIEDAATVYQALAWFQGGMDFADALHIASRGKSAQFLTFDKGLVSAARRAGTKGVVQP